MTNIIHSYNEETIRALAHQKWIDEGKPDGRDEIHWQWALASLTASAVRPTSTTTVADDVSLIDGIGPKLTKVLAAEGITKLSQIAGLTDSALAKLDTKLALKGRATREDWIAQAKELLAGHAPRAKVDQAKVDQAKAVKAK